MPTVADAVDTKSIRAPGIQLQVTALENLVLLENLELKDSVYGFVHGKSNKILQTLKPFRVDFDPAMILKLLIQ